jgi:hypothetical protein
VAVSTRGIVHAVAVRFSGVCTGRLRESFSVKLTRAVSPADGDRALVVLVIGRGGDDGVLVACGQPCDTVEAAAVGDRQRAAERATHKHPRTFNSAPQRVAHKSLHCALTIRRRNHDVHALGLLVFEHLRDILPCVFYAVDDRTGTDDCEAVGYIRQVVGAIMQRAGAAIDGVRGEHFGVGDRIAVNIGDCPRDYADLAVLAAACQHHSAQKRKHASPNASLHRHTTRRFAGAAVSPAKKKGGQRPPRVCPPAKGGWYA